MQDAHLRGIVHLVEGNVTVDYPGSSYGAVIRARAPQVQMIEGFVNRGDLYAPAMFAYQDWWNRKPDVDIAVKDGNISLRLRAPQIAQRTQIDLGNLENLLRKNPREFPDKILNYIKDELKSNNKY